MSARGVDFLENWIGANVPLAAGDRSQARKLAQKLVVDAMVARIRVSDLELGDSDVAECILRAMEHLDKR
jgi:hypothetical protein